MSCCAPGAELALEMANPQTANEEVLLASRIIGDGVRQTDLSVPAFTAAAASRRSRRRSARFPAWKRRAVNLSTKRVAIRWRADESPATVHRDA